MEAAQAGLHESEERFWRLFAGAGTGMAVSTPDGRYLQANDAYCRMLGYTEDELRGRNFASLTHPDDLHLNLKLRDELLAGARTTFLLEKRYLKKGGGVVWARHSVSAMHGPAGEIAKLVVIAEDISERKLAEDALRRSEERLRLITDLVPHGIFAKDSAGRHIFANPALAEIAGLPIGEILGKDDFDLVIDRAQAEAYRADDLAVIRSGRKMVVSEEPRTDLAGRMRFLQTIKVPFTVPETGEPGVLGVCIDITERKRIEARFRRLVDSNVQGVFFWNTDGRITDANDAFLCMVGRMRAELDAGRLSWAEMTPPDMVEIDQRALKQLATTGVCQPFEKVFIHRDGSRVPVLMAPATFADSPNEGFCFVLNLTERRRLEQQFQQAQKMEAIGQLTGGMAHDFNNLLAVILGNLGFLERKFKPGTDEWDLTREATKAALHGADLTRALLAFARRQPLAPKLTDLTETLGTAGRLFQRTLGENLTVEINLADRLWPVLIDVAQIESAILNLAVNARDAMPDGGILTIEARNVTLAEGAAELNPEAGAGDYLVISVSDTGCGMTPAVIAKAFDPFFTTKGARGSGLGLSMVHGFVKQSGGHTRIYSEPGKGTTINIYLPRATDSRIAAAGEEAPPTAPTGHETILVVEDNKALRNLVLRQLKDLGYRTIAAADAAEALSVIRRNEPIDLLFTDVVMPGGMDGRALAREAQALRPDLKVLFTSGFTAAAATAVLADDFTASLLNKPYHPNELAQRVRAAIDGLR
jgi:PAS domain S-box-containing protein